MSIHAMRLTSRLWTAVKKCIVKRKHALVMPPKRNRNRSQQAIRIETAEHCRTFIRACDQQHMPCARDQRDGHLEMVPWRGGAVPGSHRSGARPRIIEQFG